MADPRRVYVCHECDRCPTCVAVSALESGDEMIRCPRDYDVCEWTELDPILAAALLGVLAGEQADQMPRVRC
jgi:hypothetical protein